VIAEACWQECDHLTHGNHAAATPANPCCTWVWLPRSTSPPHPFGALAIRAVSGRTRPANAKAAFPRALPQAGNGSRADRRAPTAVRRQPSPPPPAGESGQSPSPSRPRPSQRCSALLSLPAGPSAESAVATDPGCVASSAAASSAPESRPSSQLDPIPARPRVDAVFQLRRRASSVSVGGGRPMGQAPRLHSLSHPVLRAGLQHLFDSILGRRRDQGLRRCCC